MQYKPPSQGVKKERPEIKRKAKSKIIKFNQKKMTLWHISNGNEDSRTIIVHRVDASNDVAFWLKDKDKLKERNNRFGKVFIQSYLRRTNSKWKWTKCEKTGKDKRIFICAGYKRIMKVEMYKKRKPGLTVFMTRKKNGKDETVEIEDGETREIQHLDVLKMVFADKRPSREYEFDFEIIDQGILETQDNDAL